MKSGIAPVTSHIARFAATMGVSDPAEAVKLRARQLVHELPGPPYQLDCDGVKRTVNVGQIRLSRTLTGDGRIFLDGDTYTIEINPRVQEARRRFTLAHEIAHSFFLPLDIRAREGRTDGLTERYAKDDGEEYLCDVAAAEMLMPTAPFLERVCRYGPSVRSILLLAKVFGASLTSTARRFAEINAWKCYIGFWRSDSSGRLEFQNGFASGKLALVIPRGSFAPVDSVVARALSHREVLRGYSDVGLMSRRSEPIGEVFSETVAIAGSRQVLSVSILDKYPEQLCGMVEEWTKRQREKETRSQSSIRFPS